MVLERKLKTSLVFTRVALGVGILKQAENGQTFLSVGMRGKVVLPGTLLLQSHVDKYL
jgi:hypothetical protein